jgi:hypothetical protein
MPGEPSVVQRDKYENRRDDRQVAQVHPLKGWDMPKDDRVERAMQLRYDTTIGVLDN